jgi:DNA polymerase I-like protein with 3'-5' exonuclease and polymerase domains
MKTVKRTSKHLTEFLMGNKSSCGTGKRSVDSIRASSANSHLSAILFVERSMIAMRRESISSHVSLLQQISKQVDSHPESPVLDIPASCLTGLAIHSSYLLDDPRAESGCFWPDEDSHAIAASVVRDINESKVLKTLHNGSYDSSYFIRDQLGLTNWFLDSMVLWWSLYMELPKKLQFVTSVLCDNYQFWKDDIKGDEQDSVDVNAERYWRYNGLDTYYTLFDTCYLVVLLMKNKAMQFNYRDAMLRVYSGLAMSMRGMAVDWKRRDDIREQLMEQMEAATQELRYIIDEPDFNINSSDHKKSLIYDVFGLRERTARGRFVDPTKTQGRD